MLGPAAWLRVFGIDPRRGRRSFAGLARYLGDRRRFRRGSDASFAWGRERPILADRNAASGRLGAYFHQDFRVAAWILEAEPARHVDVGSRIDGFVGALALSREVEVLDVRPQPVAVPNVTFRRVDLMLDLPPEWRESTPSLSCLHALEHFGLGRYGDTIDADGHRKGLTQLKRMVAPEGVLYLSVPIGPQRVEFNAHRVFAAATLLGWFAEGWEIERFLVIDDACRVLEDPPHTGPAVDAHFGCRTGLGIVAARKTDRPTPP